MKSVLLGDIQIDYYDDKDAVMHIPGVHPEIIEEFEITTFDYSVGELVIVAIFVDIEHINFYTLSPTGERFCCTPKISEQNLAPEDDWEDEFQKTCEEMIRTNLFEIELQNLELGRIRSASLPQKKSRLVKIEIYTPSPTGIMVPNAE